MRGVFAMLGVAESPALPAVVRAGVDLLRHCGPDCSSQVHCADGVYLAQSGQQPLQSGKTTLSIKGTIYNDHELAELCNLKLPLQTDGEIILHLHRRWAPARWLQQLRGMFALVLHQQRTWLIARDHLGIVPLYLGWLARGGVAVATELKALEHICVQIQTFPSGHYWTSAMGTPQPWYKPSWTLRPGNNPPQLPQLRDLLQATVTMHAACTVPWGVVLTGRVESTVIATLAARPQLPSFAIRLAGAPDRTAEIAAKLGLCHHGVTFTAAQGIAVLSDVIYHLESFDVATVRAGVPMFLLAQYMSKQQIRMVLSGDGSDYLDVRSAPSAPALYHETVTRLHHDGCCTHKVMAAFGIEMRVPFLDRHVVQRVMSIHPRHLMVRSREKHLLRQAFADVLPDALPEPGVAWADALQGHANAVIRPEQLAQAVHVYPLQTPRTPEQLLYRQLFAVHFRNTTNMLGIVNHASVRSVSTREKTAVRPAGAAAPYRRRSRSSATQK
jgi:asparagine synthase (glutamine-hydrolysing)